MECSPWSMARERWDKCCGVRSWEHGVGEVVWVCGQEHIMLKLVWGKLLAQAGEFLHHVSGCFAAGAEVP
eukprot:326080-Ditylum_brightwellii.AAC.2